MPDAAILRCQERQPSSTNSRDGLATPSVEQVPDGSLTTPTGAIYQVLTGQPLSFEVGAVTQISRVN